ncbi:MAG: hypothetical protein ACLQNE_26165 [Thermoguttaceae bacterium]
MRSNPQKTSYGTMFPSILPPEADRLVSGKVFSYELTRAGGFLVSHRRVAVNMAEWDDCLKCPEFDHCYKLCMGRFALEAAISR